MIKTITICDYCGKEITGRRYTLMAVRETEEGTWRSDPDHTKRPDICRECIGIVQSIISPEALTKRHDAALKEKADAASKQQEPAENTETAAETTPAKKEVGKPSVDHDRIVALYTATPPRSIEWIADDCKCSKSTVVNHLVKAGLYQVKTPRRIKVKDKEQEDEA